MIQFEDWVDTGEEYAMLDEVSKDRAAAGRRLSWRSRSVAFGRRLSDEVAM